MGRINIKIKNKNSFTDISQELLLKGKTEEYKEYK